MRIVIACDSFKGSLSSAEAARFISVGVRRVFPDAMIDVVPIADGGEGTAVTLTEALGGKLEQVGVYGPMGNPVEAVFGILPGGEAVMDMSSASGLTLVPEGETNVMAATTYGVGQLILAALDKGCRSIYLGIGGSATNDGGLGMAQALGVRFYDREGGALAGLVRPSDDPPPLGSFLAGRDLANVASVSLTEIDPRLAPTEIRVLCDVTNPLCGPSGASHIYGPQKGAVPSEIAKLDAGLAHLAGVVRRDCAPGVERDYAEEPGAGAAGGLGFGLMAFTGAKLIPGVDFMLTAAGFDEKALLADLVITGEGRLDHQSAFGKVPAGVAGRGIAAGTPVIAIGGAIEGDMQALFDAGVCAVEACVCSTIPLSEAMEKAPALLVDAAERIIRSIALGMRLTKSAEEGLPDKPSLCLSPGV